MFKAVFAAFLLGISALVGAAPSAPLWKVCDTTCLTVADLSCASVYAALGLTNAPSCSSDPMTVGSYIVWLNADRKADAFVIDTISPACSVGQKYNSVSSMCEDAPVDGVCVPAVRTISPCPSGFAPSQTAPGPGVFDPYESKFDSIPMQDILYSIGMCLFGVLGIAVGVKLT